jgi:hypothetical protein
MNEWVAQKDHWTLFKKDLYSASISLINGIYHFRADVRQTDGVYGEAGREKELSAAKLQCERICGVLQTQKSLFDD